jgi:hypothetical protein
MSGKRYVIVDSSNLSIFLSCIIFSYQAIAIIEQFLARRVLMTYRTENKHTLDHDVRFKAFKYLSNSTSCDLFLLVLIINCFTYILQMYYESIFIEPILLHLLYDPTNIICNNVVAIRMSLVNLYRIQNIFFTHQYYLLSFDTRLL